MMQTSEFHTTPHANNYATIDTLISEDLLSERIRLILERSEALLPEEQALALAAAAATLGEFEILRLTIHAGIKHGATPLEFYEVLLQTYLFAGFPAALEALSILHSVCTELNCPLHPPEAAPYSVQAFIEQGTALCQEIYTRAYTKMHNTVTGISPDLAAWMIIEGYGKTLSRPHVAPRVRELCIVSSLAVGGWNNQLYSHLRGSMNVGAAPIECIDILRNLEIFSAPHIQEHVHDARHILEVLLGRAGHESQPTYQPRQHEDKNHEDKN